LPENDESLSTNDEGNPNDEARMPGFFVGIFGFRHSGFGILSSLGNSSFVIPAVMSLGRIAIVGWEGRAKVTSQAPRFNSHDFPTGAMPPGLRDHQQSGSLAEEVLVSATRYAPNLPNLRAKP